MMYAQCQRQVLSFPHVSFAVFYEKKWKCLCINTFVKSLKKSVKTKSHIFCAYKKIRICARIRNRKIWNLKLGLLFIQYQRHNYTVLSVHWIFWPTFLSLYPKERSFPIRSKVGPGIRICGDTMHSLHGHIQPMHWPPQKSSTNLTFSAWPYLANGHSVKALATIKQLCRPNLPCVAISS